MRVCRYSLSLTTCFASINSVNDRVIRLPLIMNKKKRGSTRLKKTKYIANMAIQTSQQLLYMDGLATIKLTRTPVQRG